MVQIREQKFSLQSTWDHAVKNKISLKNDYFFHIAVWINYNMDNSLENKWSYLGLFTSVDSGFTSVAKQISISIATFCLADTESLPLIIPFPSRTHVCSSLTDTEWNSHGHGMECSPLGYCLAKKPSFNTLHLLVSLVLCCVFLSASYVLVFGQGCFKLFFFFGYFRFC